jgi:hypothetical protein
LHKEGVFAAVAEADQAGRIDSQLVKQAEELARRPFSSSRNSAEAVAAIAPSPAGRLKRRPVASAVVHLPDVGQLMEQCLEQQLVRKGTSAAG